MKKNAEPIEQSFEMVTANRVLDGIHIGAI